MKELLCTVASECRRAFCALTALAYSKTLASAAEAKRPELAAELSIEAVSGFCESCSSAYCCVVPLAPTAHPTAHCTHALRALLSGAGSLVTPLHTDTH